jgi:hypothetical protein
VRWRNIQATAVVSTCTAPRSEARLVATINRRMAGQIDGDFVVFLIGARINKPWKIHKWLPIARAMQRMIKELQAAPSEQTGFLGHESFGSLMVQYWRSFDHLERYARNPDQAHFPAWVDFYRRNGKAFGDVGIWHETYCVRAGEYEAIYGAMPPMGLGKVGRLVEARSGLKSARQRAGRGQEPQDELGALTAAHEGETGRATPADAAE